jgi:hypothetical protein
LALTGWTGPHADTFRSRVGVEHASAAAVVDAMRDEAQLWAAAWQQAVDQENWIRYQYACRAIRESRSKLDKLFGHFVGHDDLPPEPKPAALPQPPDFAATRRLADYSRD